MSRSAVLILGYSRPDFLRKRLDELASIRHGELDLIVSLDKYEGSDSIEVRARMKEIESHYSKLTWLTTPARLGLVEHITRRITESLQIYENIVVIEDDVSSDANAISSLISIMPNLSDSNFFTAGLFGALPKSFASKLLTNRWRVTEYFSAWGWAINKTMWSMYDHKIVAKLGKEKVQSTVAWKKLNPNQQKRWLFRFSRVESNPNYTWDYQMQFLTWLYELEHLLPTWRLCDNEGFDSEKATNTRSSKPIWYRGKRSKISGNRFSISYSEVLSNSLKLVDSYTWIGDRKPFDLIRRK